MMRGLCLVLMVLAAGLAEAGGGESWRGRDVWRGGESRVWRGHEVGRVGAPHAWRGHEGWRAGVAHSWRGHEGWRDGHARAWRGAWHGGLGVGRPWTGSPWVGVHANPWPVRPWGPVFVERAEPFWVEGELAGLRPRTICVKPQPGYDYTGWEAPPPHRFLPADYRCITTQ
jgi:hypothetical protein